MLKLGVIGTGAISHHFIEAAHTSGQYQLVAVYSRKLETAATFASRYQDIQLFDQLEDFFKSSFDVVYIASPNSLHFVQAKAALSAGKHIILEKPAVTQPQEWMDLRQTAEKNQCFIFEAARNYHEEAFTTIKNFLTDKQILGADFNYAKYSSKMPDLLAGQTPNVFSDRFAGGALMDLGIYPLYAAVRLFGKAQDATYQAHKLDNSIDLNGDGMLFYPNFQVHIKAGKNITSNLPCEIYTADGTLTLNTIEHVRSAIFTNHQGNQVQLPIQQAPHTMTEEVAAFTEMIQQPDQTLYQNWLNDAGSVHDLLYTMRQTAGIRFEAEKMKTKLPTEWQELSDQLGFQKFTPIQTQLFEPILAGENLLGVSPTGTGKTLAYLMPSLLRLQKKKAQQLLILAPNTELAGQIFDVCKTWSEAIGLTAQLFLSGSSQKRQIERLKKGPEILIGTPGRIFELIKLKKIKMMNVETIILDEFDQLLDDSQIHFVEKITHYAPRDHQLIYMSATTKFDQEKIAPNTRTIDLSDQKLDNIQHFYMQVDQRHRVDMLRKLAHVEDFRGLVFFNSLSDLGNAEEKLQYRDILAVSLASDVNVKFRKVILEKFKDKQLTLLLATDLLARGIDIDSLECVVNFDIPRDIETYTHRAGRTGRMGKEGYVITLVTHPEELKKLKKFANVREIVLKNQELYIK